MVEEVEAYDKTDEMVLASLEEAAKARERSKRTQEGDEK